MIRSDGDSWDIVTSVGATALGVAAMRAVETLKRNALIRDEYARHFVAATRVEAPFFSEIVEDGALRQDAEVDLFASYIGMRSRYFDDYLIAAGQSGIVQVVVLAAGLDARSHRLRWPAGTLVYELDLPKVLQFKRRVFQECGAAGSPLVRSAPVDLRADWPKVLRDAGFDPTQPTAWLAEGLIPYLPRSGRELLFARVADLSSRGSQIAGEDFAAGESSTTSVVDAMSQNGPLRKMLNVAAGRGERPSGLWFGGDRMDPARWFVGHGWQVADTTTRELFVRYGQTLHSTQSKLADALSEIPFFTAVLTA